MMSCLSRASLWAAAWLCIAGAGAADTVKIAFIGDMSGPYALQNQERFKTFLAAADIVNSRGGVLGGRKIEMAAFDNKLDPRETLIVLRRAIDQDFHYVTSTLSSTAHAISDAVVKHNARNPDRLVLFLDYGALDPALTESKCNFWHFRFQSHADMQVNVLTDYMAKLPSIRKVYLLNQDYAFGHAVRRAAREMLSAKRPDIRIVGDDLVPLGKVKDFSPYVAKIRATGADGIVTSNSGNDLSLLVKASSEAGLTATYYAILGGLPGTWAAVPASGTYRVRTVDTWHINAADQEWEARLLEYRTRLKAVSNLDYMPPYRVVEMFAAAVDKAGSADPLKVAFALEGMRHTGPSGESWMRAEDHQLIDPLYVLSLVKAGQPGAPHDVEGTGYGWKTEVLVEAKDNIPPVKCTMERPERP
ncbi:MAG TPA: branched-chain amino acid ABC transporter substrate-binding protein [Burkholderiales bacterium]|nr:branched-chain amino acid ABC transporter substrate-binding protein [Burkholderiales bacterium]